MIKNQKKKCIILHGSSCIGKSYIMNKIYVSKLDDYSKLEMDNCGYWKNHPNDTKKKNEICVDFLIKNIKNKNMIVTCGGLPAPCSENAYEIYKNIETKYNIEIKHILVLCKNIINYKKNIIKRGLGKNMNELLKSYKWRYDNKQYYDRIIYNDPNLIFSKNKVEKILDFSCEL